MIPTRGKEQWELLKKYLSLSKHSLYEVYLEGKTKNKTKIQNTHIHTQTRMKERQQKTLKIVDLWHKIRETKIEKTMILSKFVGFEPIVLESLKGC